MAKASRSRYHRIRVCDPKKFKAGSFRAHDIGRRGHSKRIAGRLKKSGKWATQAFLVSKTDWASGYRPSKMDYTIKRQKLKRIC
jgi:hypothetical protein